MAYQQLSPWDEARFRNLNNPLAFGNPSAFTSGGPWQVSGDSGNQSDYAQNNPGAYMKDTGVAPEQLFTGNIWNPESSTFEPPQTAELKQSRLMDLTGMKTAADIEKARMAADSRIGVAGINKESSQFSAEETTRRVLQKAKDSGIELTPEATAFWADYTRRTGQLPPLGMGASDTRKKLLNAAAVGAKPGESVVENKAQLNADTGSLNMLQKMNDGIGAFEKKTLVSFDIAKNIADKVSRGQYPGLNKWAQIIQYQGGDENLKAFKNALMTAAMDYQKIVTAGTQVTATELSIGAQARAEQMLSTFDNTGSFAKALETIKLDIAAAKKANADQLAEVRARINGGAADATAVSPPAQGAAPAGAPKEGDTKQSTVDPSKSFIFRGGKWQVN